MTTAVTLSALLLFLLEPMIAKRLLPAYGGASSVWTTCLLFFQSTLVAGYAYAHFARRSLHVAFVAISAVALLLPIPDPIPGCPTLSILRTLLAAAGLPAILLSSTSPLAQRWSGSAFPYRLYSLSNAASLTALLAYPVLIEPYFPLSTQWTIWRGAYLVFAIFSALLARNATPQSAAPLSLAIQPMWILLSACGSALLLAISNQITQEVASLPFLWVVPLALYLLTFVFCFRTRPLYSRRAFAILAAVLIPLSCTLIIVGLNVSFWISLVVFLATLFVCAMLCHGELAASKPEPSLLTSYYLAIAAGGAVGGLSVAIIAPLVFTSYAELPVLLGATAALALLPQYRDPSPLRKAALIGLSLSVAVPITVLTPNDSASILAARRNFYGILRVTESAGKRVLTHGAITHGAQLLDRPGTPTTYYGYASGVGRAIEERARESGHPLRVGIVGLGAGTLARYGRQGDSFRFYELNPAVITLARQHFTFLKDSRASVEIQEGDARLSLANGTPQAYDLLIVDAFSSDAIPVHLLTAEAAQVYRRQLAPDGRLLFHISNHTLDLEPVVRGLARSIGFAALRHDSPRDSSQGVEAAAWMILQPGADTPPPQRTLLWTDDSTSLLPILKRNR